MLLLDGISSWLKFKLILYDEVSNAAEEIRCACKKKKCKKHNDTHKNKSIPPIRFLNYCHRHKAFLSNEKGIVTICIDGATNLPTLIGGNLGGEFVLSNIHFHLESENTVDGRKYPLEAHYVHLNKGFEDLEAAIEHESGLVVLAVMYEVTCDPNPILDNIIKAIENRSEELEEIEGNFIGSHYIPKQRYLYNLLKGSEYCCEFGDNAKWIVFHEILSIGEEQLQRIREASKNKNDRDFKK